MVGSDPRRHSGDPRRGDGLARPRDWRRGLLHRSAAAREHSARPEDHGPAGRSQRGLGDPRAGVSAASCSASSARSFLFQRPRSFRCWCRSSSRAMASTHDRGTRHDLRHVFLHLSRYCPRDDLAAGGGLSRDVPGDLGDSLLNMWILGLGRREPAACSSRAQMSLAELLERQHLSSRAARARILGNAVRPGAADPADLPPDRESDPLLQPAFPEHVRALGPRDVPAGARVHTAIARGVRRPAFSLRSCPIASRKSPTSRRSARSGCRSRCTASAAISSTSHTTRARRRQRARSLMQNWSCGYFLIYFTPFVAAVRRASDPRDGPRARLARLGGVSAPRRSSSRSAPGRFSRSIWRRSACTACERPLAEIVGFSAKMSQLFHGARGACDCSDRTCEHGRSPRVSSSSAFVAARGLPRLRLRASLPERAWSAQRRCAAGRAGQRRVLRSTLAIVLGIVAMALTAGLIGVIFTGGFVTSIAGVPIRATNAPRQLARIGGGGRCAAAVSGRFRATAAAFMRFTRGASPLSRCSSPRGCRSARFRRRAVPPSAASVCTACCSSTCPASRAFACRRATQ